MKSITLKTSAKVNLSLDVVGKRDDGYHNIESVFQSVGIYDIVTVSKRDDGEIRISCSDPDVPCDRKNIAFKAAEIFFDITGISGGISIDIEKHIPSQAGLGGGSSDGAAVIFALNSLYDKKLSPENLVKIGSEISADTAFFINGGTAYIEGIGDIIKPIRFIPTVDMVIAKGADGVSTPFAYRQIDMLYDAKHPKTQKLLKAIDKGKFLNHCGLCENIFEQVTDINDVSEIKKMMLDHGALTSLMSGSGSSVFGIFEKKSDSVKCAETLKKAFPFAEYCTSVGNSIKTVNIN